MKGKNVYGNQIVVSLLSCDGLVLPYSIDIYDKESMSKIESAKRLTVTLPNPENKVYVLADSWYVRIFLSERIMNKYFSIGFLEFDQSFVFSEIVSFH